MANVVIRGAASGNGAEVDASGNLLLSMAGTSSATPSTIGATRIFSENDIGNNTGTAYIASPETDADYRLRVAQEVLLDYESFTYAAQNTGKYSVATTTQTITYSTDGALFNASAITTANTGVNVTSYQTYSLTDPGTICFCAKVKFSATQDSNITTSIGLFRNTGATSYAPNEGVWFSFNSAGIRGITLASGGSNSITGPFKTSDGSTNMAVVANQVYELMAFISERSVTYWIDGAHVGTDAVPNTLGRPFMSLALPFSMTHAIGSAAAVAVQATLKSYSVSAGGLGIGDDYGVQGNRIHGSYQGLSGGTMGSLANYANSTNPTGAGGSNTTALVTGLGGQFALNAAASAATDFIITSYQNPAGTTAVPGKRMKITGVRIDAINNGAAVATTATTLQWSLAFGHTAVSLATAEAAAAKAPRRIALGLQTWAISAAIGAGPQNGPIDISFKDGPIYVNPGEFVATVAKFLIGTATASQVINGTVTIVYSWE